MDKQLECQSCHCLEVEVVGVEPGLDGTIDITYICRNCGQENHQKARLTGVDEDGTMQCEIEDSSQGILMTPLQL